MKRASQPEGVPDLAYLPKGRVKDDAAYYTAYKDFWKPVPEDPLPPAYQTTYYYARGTLSDLKLESGDLIVLQDASLPLRVLTRDEEKAMQLEARGPPPGFKGPGYAGHAGTDSCRHGVGRIVG